jgi:hypothetical protein
MKVVLNKVDDMRWASKDNRFVIQGRVSCAPTAGERFYIMTDRVTGDQSHSDTLTDCREYAGYILESETVQFLFNS